MKICLDLTKICLEYHRLCFPYMVHYVAQSACVSENLCHAIKAYLFIADSNI